MVAPIPREAECSVAPPRAEAECSVAPPQAEAPSEDVEEPEAKERFRRRGGKNQAYKGICFQWKKTW